MRDDLQGGLAAIREAAGRVGKVANECRMSLDVDEYVDHFRPDLMDITAAWARGATFSEILKMSTIFEGSLVRAIRRLEELLRQLVAALQGIGELDLAARFEEAGTRIKRDIIFAASLYL